MKDPGRTLIIGGGPTGLGAAYRFQEAGFDGFHVLEAQDHPGGLAASYLDEKGFNWDLGGHVQFSHYRYYDGVLDRALGDDWLHHQREAWIWIKNRFVPYPFQYNIHRLDPHDRDRALRGLEEAAADRRHPKPANFREWIECTFGQPMAELFLLPYNFKLWGYPADLLSVRWVGERVAVPEVERVKENVRSNRDQLSWGPNSTFRFPARGGTGAIWMGVSRLLPPARFRFGCQVTGVDSASRTVLLADASSLPYDTLITTVPLDLFCGLCGGLESEVHQAASLLLHSTTHVLGLGLRRGRPDSLRTKCWMYFPEGHSPYYRVTVFSNYSPNNVPEGDGYWSLMAEVCETGARPVQADKLWDWVIEALRRDELITPHAEIVSLWHRRIEHAYPTPFLQRDEVLGRILPRLEKARIFSRGRFGAWKYEVSNQDHSFMQGVELADRLLGIGEEVTLNAPDYVNSGALLGSAARHPKVAVERNAAGPPAEGSG